MNIKKMSFFLRLLCLFLTSAFLHGQDCTEFTFPNNGADNIEVNTTLTWTEVLGYNGYLLSIGTTPQGTDILDRKPIGTNPFYTPPLGLPDDTTMYATLSLVPYDGPPISCDELVLTTVEVTTAPTCSVLITPDNNAGSVTIITDIEWDYVPTATGYYLSIGTTPNGHEIVNNLDIKNELSYDPPEDLPQNSNIYVKIEPYNDIGIATSCTEEIFTTSFAVYVCDPYISETTGELIYRAPIINLPNIVGICSDELPYTISSNDVADGFRWFLTNSGSEETLLSETQSVAISAPGKYRFEAYNKITTDAGDIECISSKLIDVVASEKATITAINVTNFPLGKTILISVTGGGQYEYSLTGRDGPFQDSSMFTEMPTRNYTAYIRDKNGCGTTERLVDRDISKKDFPSFFSPNGDGINDHWQYIPPVENFEAVIDVIHIYNQFGSLIQQINPNSIGWDGTFNTKQMPQSDYWYKASFLNQQPIMGHFSLIR
ncbi:T9SS type B sorting domain-containing protein [Maribacter sp. Asnod2-G09]|uniref:T9SS type B sorting domain-containing protein n=1 Tax=Maribacter sp. Asnod2-G09 TaxID=3160577 RepID=UPI0038682FB6